MRTEADLFIVVIIVWFQFQGTGTRPFVTTKSGRGRKLIEVILRVELAASPPLLYEP